MKPPYKVTLPSRLDPTEPMTFDDAVNALGGPFAWLRDTNRYHHLLNAYFNDDRGVTFVFSDPTTAMLFRLSN